MKTLEFSVIESSPLKSKIRSRVFSSGYQAEFDFQVMTQLFFRLVAGQQQEMLRAGDILSNADGILVDVRSGRFAVKSAGEELDSMSVLYHDFVVVLLEFNKR